MSGATEQLPQEAWGPYFDTISKDLGTTLATVEVVGRDVGDQIEADHLVLTGISYDHKDDVIVIGLDAPGGLREEMERMVDHPRAIYVAPGPVTSPGLIIDIEDEEEHRTIVRLEQAPELPADADAGTGSG
jgi:hypothetical protein